MGNPVRYQYHCHATPFKWIVREQNKNTVPGFILGGIPLTMVAKNSAPAGKKPMLRRGILLSRQDKMAYEDSCVV